MKISLAFEKIVPPATLLVENITNAFEKKKKVIGVFLDLSKAFDTIDQWFLKWVRPNPRGSVRL